MVNQIEQWKQVNPHNIDEVPVQAADFEGRVIFLSKASLPRHHQKPGKDAQANDHVQRVQPGHDEVEREENLGVTRVRILPRMVGNFFMLETEGSSRDVVLDKLVAIFLAFDAEKGKAEEHGQDEHGDHEHAPCGLGSPNGKDDGQAAADEDSGVGSAQRGINRFAGGCEISEVPAAINQIGAKQAAEKHDFSAEED